jgi:regulator of sigma E protease
MIDLANVGSIVLLILGFGFVIFWHELGHFLAAKWVGIKVEQFAVGFGHAVLCWRKGLGLRIGTTKREYDRRIADHLAGANVSGAQARETSQWPGQQEAAAAAALGLGDTEYRLNWLPLGGYVKMLGQDDLRPNALSDDPRAYNRKSVAARMLVVSAGVLMNVLLAAVGFMAVFLMGFEAPAPVVGSVLSGSPAADAIRVVNGKAVPAPLMVGDQVLRIDGKTQHDFTKIMLTTALAEQGLPIPVTVRRVDGRIEELQIAPQRPGEDSHSFVAIGTGQSMHLRGLDPDKYKQLVSDAEAEADPILREAAAIKPGDTIFAVNDEPVTASGKPGEPSEYYKLDRALQASAGKPVRLSVRSQDGQVHTVLVQPHFQFLFGGEELSFAGMRPRPTIPSVSKKSPMYDRIQPGDVVISIVPSEGGKGITYPSGKEFRAYVGQAAADMTKLEITLERDGEQVVLSDVVPSHKLSLMRTGLGVGEPRPEEDRAVVGAVKDGSPAATAGIPSGARLTNVGGTPAQSWYDVKQALGRATAGAAIPVVATVDGREQRYELTLDARTIRAIAGLQYTHLLALHDHTTLRETSNPAIAAWWGVTETRDFVLQFYLTLQRMFQGSVSYKNVMGPVGIFGAGTRFALQGMDWLVWFLSMISANLAVVNFLPIPIVDGGLFLFLVIEKIQGRPLSPRAQSIAQVVGLALILSVFLLVTVQDIVRYL